MLVLGLHENSLQIAGGLIGAYGGRLQDVLGVYAVFAMVAICGVIFALVLSLLVWLLVYMPRRRQKLKALAIPSPLH